MYEYLDRRYALALYKIGEEKGKVEQYLDELRKIVAIINEDQDFVELIKHPQVSTSSKKKIFIDVFKDQIDEDLLAFLLVLIEKGRILQLEGKLKQMEKIYLEKNKTAVAKVKTVVPLKDEEKKNLVIRLEKQYDKKILLEEEIDPTIIGGVYVQVDNEVIDGTIKSKMDEMKKLMLKRD